MEEFKKYKHNPPHLFKPNAKYFITSSIYQSKRLLKGKAAKSKLFEYILKSVNNFNWKLYDWVILDNHYHLMLDGTDKPEDLSAIMGNIHRFSALWIKKNVSSALSVNKIWHNYWDSCITFEASYFARLNYIWYNPVKHLYVKNPEEWEFGSFYKRFKEDKDYLLLVKERYPFDKLDIDDDF